MSPGKRVKSPSSGISASCTSSSLAPAGCSVTSHPEEQKNKIVFILLSSISSFGHLYYFTTELWHNVEARLSRNIENVLYIRVSVMDHVTEFVNLHPIASRLTLAHLICQTIKRPAYPGIMESSRLQGQVCSCLARLWNL